jgi:hypothetical protein
MQVPLSAKSGSDSHPAANCYGLPAAWRSARFSGAADRPISRFESEPFGDQFQPLGAEKRAAPLHAFSERFQITAVAELPRSARAATARSGATSCK